MEQAEQKDLDKLKAQFNKVMESNYEFAPEQFSSHENYLDGCVIAMDSKDAMELTSDLLVEDGYPQPKYSSSLFDVAIHNYEIDPSDNIEQTIEWIQEDIAMNLMFFRFKDASTFKSLDDVLKTVSYFAFWSPIYVMLNGTWYNTQHLGAVDTDGNNVGIRF